MMRQSNQKNWQMLAIFGSNSYYFLTLTGNFIFLLEFMIFPVFFTGLIMYPHYFEITQRPDQVLWAQLMLDVEKLFKNLPTCEELEQLGVENDDKIILRGPMGDKKPICNMYVNTYCLAHVYQQMLKARNLILILDCLGSLISIKVFLMILKTLKRLSGIFIFLD